MVNEAWDSIFNVLFLLLETAAYSIQLVYEASCIFSPSAVKKRHLFTSVLMLRLDFLHGFYLATRLLAVIVDFYFFTEHYFSHTVEASHRSMLCGGDRCKIQSNHLFSPAAVHTQALELQQGLARKEGGSGSFSIGNSNQISPNLESARLGRSSCFPAVGYTNAKQLKALKAAKASLYPNI